MSLIAAPSVHPPGAGLISRFGPAMRAVALTWRDCSKAGAQLTLTSWWRSKDKNEATPHSAEFSQHLLGCAMDCTAANLSQQELYTLARRYSAARGTTVLISERGAVHCQGLPTGAVRALVTREPTLLAGVQSFVGPPMPVQPITSAVYRPGVNCLMGPC
jgi:Peptidase M15